MNNLSFSSLLTLLDSDDIESKILGLSLIETNKDKLSQLCIGLLIRFSKTELSLWENNTTFALKSFTYSDLLTSISLPKVTDEEIKFFFTRYSKFLSHTTNKKITITCE